MTESAARLILANLDCESTWAEDVAPTSTCAGARPLKPRVRQALAALGTLVRAFARPGDVLWTLEDVDPGRVSLVEGIGSPALVSGPLARQGEAVVSLAWAETTAVASLRGTSVEADPHSHADHWIDELRATFPQTPGSARRANERSFATELRERHGLGVPGAFWIRSRGELSRHLASGVLEATGTERWVLKAPFSAAGRGRVFGRGSALEEGPVVERALHEHGRMLFEPWLERLADFGCCALVTDDGTKLLGVHEQEVDGAGRPRAVRVPVASRGHSRAAPPRALQASEWAELERAVGEVGTALSDLGYRGPFGLDSWRYRRPDGAVGWVAIGEVNARLTMGFVARALLERVPVPEPEPETMRFEFGQRVVQSRPREAAPFVPLLLAGAADGTEALLEYRG